MMKSAAAAVLAMLLAACAQLAELEPPGQEAAPAALRGPVGYCYQTLAGVDCYRTPRPGDTLVGVDMGPKPR